MSTDWIKLFTEDRHSIAKQMRENAASDLKAGYSISQITRQMVYIEEYEKETEILLQRFLSQEEEIEGQMMAYRHMKKVGAIA